MTFGRRGFVTITALEKFASKLVGHLEANGGLAEYRIKRAGEDAETGEHQPAMVQIYFSAGGEAWLTVTLYANGSQPAEVPAGSACYTGNYYLPGVRTSILSMAGLPPAGRYNGEAAEAFDGPMYAADLVDALDPGSDIVGLEYA